MREFLRWHVGFWCRYVPRRRDGTWPSMQVREVLDEPRSELEALLARTDDLALDYVTDELMNDGSLTMPPPVAIATVDARRERDEPVEAG